MSSTKNPTPAGAPANGAGGPPPASAKKRDAAESERAKASSLIAADAPISTTKALLMSIVVPRVHRVYVPDASESDLGDGEKEEEEKKKKKDALAEDGAPVVVNGSSHAKPVRKSDPKSDPRASSANGSSNVAGLSAEDANGKEEGDAPESGEDIVGYVEGEDEEEPVEHVVTAEEMAHVVKIQKSDVSSDEDDGENEQEEEVPAAETAMDKVKTFFGVVDKEKEGAKSIRLTKEESVAALKHSESFDESPNTEIRVEALLKLTFKTLLEEGHLFNAPSFASVRKDEYVDGNEWVQLTVMIKAHSIGVALERLERIGVGSSVGTVCVYRAELCKTAYDFSSPSLRKSIRRGLDSDDSSEDDDDSSSVDSAEERANMDAARAEWKNAASRLRVEQVKEQIHESASFSLDFLALLVIASILAGIGLITDGTVVIVASMLVSPIMGPVMGMTFGGRVRDWELAKWSALNEFLALLLAVAVGAGIALTASWTESAQEWPTGEMISRGDTTGLLTGIAIAIPSGMGVALSIIGNNTSSLVGVAISASLLPPAVNAGICWFHAILLRTGAAPRYGDFEDFAHIGGISFALTVINIVCIWVAGMLMFAIKEVAPTKTKSAFWSRDIKIARNVNTGAKSREVDVEAIRAGLKEALTREQRERKRAGEGEGKGSDALSSRWRRKREVRRAAGPPRAGVTFNLAVEPVPMENVRTMDEEGARAAGLGELVEPFPVPGVPRRGRGGGGGGAAGAPPGASVAGIGGALGGSAAAASGGARPPPADDDVRYLSLEDMATLLSDEDEKEAPPANRWGLGLFR